MKLDVTIHVYPAESSALSEILSLLKGLKAQGVTIMASLTDLEAAVRENTEVDNSIIVLVEGLAAKLEAIKTDPAKIQALADELRASSARQAAAVVANTPAE